MTDDEKSPHVMFINIADEETRKAVAWLQVMSMIEGKPCIYCGFEWTSRDSIFERQPITCTIEPELTFACGPCWVEHNPGVDINAPIP